MSLAREMRTLPDDLRDDPHGAGYLSLAVLCLSLSPLVYLGGTDLVATVAAVSFTVAGLSWLGAADRHLEGEQ